jgi:hypothetical protein
LGCGIEDAISPGVNGELVDGNNASDVGSAMDKILSSYENYRKGAQEWALQHNWDNIIDRVIANGKTE